MVRPVGAEQQPGHLGRPEPSRPASPTTSPRWIVRSNGASEPLRTTCSARSTGSCSSIVARSGRGCDSSAASTVSSLPIMRATRSRWLSSAVGYSPTSRPLRRMVIRSQTS